MSDSAKPEKPRLGRRVLAALGIGTTAVAMAAAKPAHAVTPPAGKAGAHYRESEHVKKFYKVNRY